MKVFSQGVCAISAAPEYEPDHAEVKRMRRPDRGAGAKKPLNTDAGLERPGGRTDRAEGGRDR